MATYCTATDLKNRLSASGVNLRADDLPPAALGDVIQDASSKIDEYCLLIYADADLQVSNWVKYRCTDIATQYLCERRANSVPGSVAKRFDRAIESLERVLKGTILIPDINARKVPAPFTSNVRTVLRPFPRTVVEPNRSTGTVTDYRRESDPVDYLNAYLDYVI